MTIVLLPLLMVCIADLNTDGRVSGADLSVILSQMGDVGDDPVQLGQCPSYHELPAWLVWQEAAFRDSVSDVPTSVGAPYITAWVVGDFNRDSIIDGRDLAVVLADFGCQSE